MKLHQMVQIHVFQRLAVSVIPMMETEPVCQTNMNLPTLWLLPTHTHNETVVRANKETHNKVKT